MNITWTQILLLKILWNCLIMRLQVWNLIFEKNCCLTQQYLSTVNHSKKLQVKRNFEVSFLLCLLKMLFKSTNFQSLRFWSIELIRMVWWNSNNSSILSDKTYHKMTLNLPSITQMSFMKQLYSSFHNMLSLWMKFHT